MSARAQHVGPVEGRIVEAGTDTPIPGAAVRVDGSYWNAAAGPDGRFALELPRGSWTLIAGAPGYRPDTVTAAIAISDSTPAPLRFDLVRSPVRLEGLTVETEAEVPLAARVTRETVRQVPPLGEPDVFRAVVLLPTISQPNDLKGRIHLAGGASDETGVRLDGHPLQNPFHLLGLTGAFNVATLERADVRVHHLPSAVGGHLSGVVDLVTRTPSAESAVEGVMSLLSSGATASLAGLPGGVDVLVSGRATYLDKLVDAARRNGLLDRSDDIPLLGYRDVLVRVGRSWRSGWRTEVIGFGTRDRLQDARLRTFDGYEPLTWGESLLGVSAEYRGSPWGIRARASLNRSATTLDQRPALRSNVIENERDHGSAAVQLSYTARRWRLRGGGSMDLKRFERRWIARGLADEVFSPNTPAEYSGAEDRALFAGFADATFDLGRRWMVQLGGRLLHLDGRWYPAPRARVSYEAAGGLQLHGALNRRHQADAQLEEPVEGSIAAPAFLLTKPRTVDMAGLSVEWEPRTFPLGATGRVNAEAFGKVYPNRPVLERREWWETREDLNDFPVFRRIRGYSAGAALGWQLHWEDGVLFQGSYTYQQVREEYDPGEWSPPAWDAPHSLTLFASLPLVWDLTVNAVYRAHSGRATTPLRARIYEPGGDLRRLRRRYVMGDRNSIRVPPYHRVDLGVRRTWSGWGADWTASLQVLNALARNNAIDYDWDAYLAAMNRDEGSGVGPGGAGIGRPGLPIVPSVGLEVQW